MPAGAPPQTAPAHAPEQIGQASARAMAGISRLSQREFTAGLKTARTIIFGFTDHGPGAGTLSNAAVLTALCISLGENRIIARTESGVVDSRTMDLSLSAIALLSHFDLLNGKAPLTNLSYLSSLMTGALREATGNKKYVLGLAEREYIESRIRMLPEFIKAASEIAEDYVKALNPGFGRDIANSDAFVAAYARKYFSQENEGKPRPDVTPDHLSVSLESTPFKEIARRLAAEAKAAPQPSQEPQKPATETHATEPAPQAEELPNTTPAPPPRRQMPPDEETLTVEFTGKFREQERHDGKGSYFTFEKRGGDVITFRDDFSVRRLRQAFHEGRLKLTIIKERKQTPAGVVISYIVPDPKYVSKGGGKPVQPPAEGPADASAPSAQAPRILPTMSAPPEPSPKADPPHTLAEFQAVAERVTTEFKAALSEMFTAKAVEVQRIIAEADTLFIMRLPDLDRLKAEAVLMGRAHMAFTGILGWKVTVGDLTVRHQQKLRDELHQGSVTDAMHMPGNPMNILLLTQEVERKLEILYKAIAQSSFNAEKYVNPTGYLMGAVIVDADFNQVLETLTSARSRLLNLLALLSLLKGASMNSLLAVGDLPDRRP